MHWGVQRVRNPDGQERAVGTPCAPGTRTPRKKGAPRVTPGRKGLTGYLSDPLEERESGWSRRRSAKARNERRSHSGAGS
jgi:hypothetical protein